MSDVQNGPDWWMASDGKWYPPQARQAPPPPPPPPQYAPPPSPNWPGAPTGAPIAAMGPTRVSTGLSGTLQGFFWATGAMALVAAVMAFAARSAFAEIEDGGFTALVDWADREDALDALTAFAYLLWFVVLVLLIIWMFKAHAVSRTLWAGKRRWSSGWTIGGWFIPFANFVIPKLVLNEIERISSAPRSPIPGHADPSQGKTSGIGWGWWILLSAGLILIAVGQQMLGTDEDLLFSKTEDDILNGYAVQGLALLCWAISCPLGALSIRRIGRQLSSAG